ncbi:NAD(P)/FAD-dependent oxidoreductase [Gordonia caeni]|uniref:NAD(P)/FAD-dependent oxidoreductase n=1 Tax=Gordonia caeni TaxID=1007097 RepID=A0ABP7NRR4_9ACTN
MAGLTAAHLLSERHTVTLFEADTRLGGHAHTQEVTTPEGDAVAVDTGFIVHNDRTYPTLLRLFAELGVATQETDMSMSVRSESSGLEYAGALGVGGLFPSWRTVRHGRYLWMLGEIRRFHRAARALLQSPGDDEPLHRFIRRERLSDYLVDNFLLPLVAAVWSCDAQTAAQYPARYLFTFLDHHGMLSVFGSPTWRTVTGGSRTYVEAVAAGVTLSGGSLRIGEPVDLVTEKAGEVTVRAGGRADSFAAAVIATHPRQALDLLAAPTAAQRRVLTAIGYRSKHAVVHTDTSLLPHARRARASWNYQIRDDGGEVAVTYDLTRLMRLPRRDHRILVTMGRTDLVAQPAVLAEMHYSHPVYDTGSVTAQQSLGAIDTDRLAFAGAYHGWGFHEDGAAAGARAGSRFGGRWRAGDPAVSASEVHA